MFLSFVQGAQPALDVASLVSSLASLPLHERLDIEQELLQLAEVTSAPGDLPPADGETQTLLPTARTGASVGRGAQLLDKTGELLSRTESMASGVKDQCSLLVDEELEQILVRVEQQHDHSLQSHNSSQRRPGNTIQQPPAGELDCHSTDDGDDHEHNHELNNLLDELLD